MGNNSGVSIGHQQHGPNLIHVLIGSVVAVATLFTSFQFIQMLDSVALVSICFFNFLFVFLLFPLEGILSHKIILLVAGNIVGIVWHFVILSFESMFFCFTAGNFKLVFLVFSPLANFMWMVSLWSISLSILAKNKQKVANWGRA
ncbi:MAG: hypothetical protein NUK63_10530 [Candidatus Bathyarchaeum tardum]|nr:MAG: hypothetical protein NUK63_10530 [Candidatus Bathyarchaeum tardum]